MTPLRLSLRRCVLWAILPLFAVFTLTNVQAQTAIDQQNAASAWTCLNVGSYTMSQSFTPTFNRMNFADIHLAGNSGPLVDGDFSLRVMRNGSLVRESDRLAIDAVSGMASGYHRFKFSSEAFLVAGQSYELQLVNHSSTGFFRWCQSEGNSYAGGSSTVSPAGGNGGDFLFRTGMDSIYSPPQATPNGNGYLLFESALKPQSPPSGGGVSVSNNFYSGLNFEVTQPTRLSKIGGYFFGSAQVFGAVFKTTGFAGKPNPVNLTGSDVIATTSLTPPVSGGDAWGDVDVQLDPGWYGIVFGTGRFGVPSNSTGLRDMGASNGPYWNPYTLIQSSGQQTFQAADVRVFAQAASAAGTVQQRPVFDTEAEKFGGQWILTDGSRDIAPYRFDFYGTDVRGLMEFDLSQIPEGAQITSVKLSLDPDQLSSGGGSGPKLHFHGYAGDGVATATDAAVALNPIGSSATITAFEVFDVDLSASYVQSLVDQGASHLGLMARGDANGHRLHFRGWEYGTVESTPLLTIEFSMPGDFDGDGFVDGDDLQLWKNGYGAGMTGNDFLAWQRNFTGAGAAAAVPEPSAAVSILTLSLALGVARRMKSVDR